MKYIKGSEEETTLEFAKPPYFKNCICIFSHK
jgi:hypothetical protein